METIVMLGLKLGDAPRDFLSAAEGCLARTGFLRDGGGVALPRFDGQLDYAA
jgi:hypothetical protein